MRTHQRSSGPCSFTQPGGLGLDARASIREMTRRAIRTSSCSSSRRVDRAKTTEYSGTPPALPTQNSFLYTLQGFSRLGRPGVSQGTVVEVLPQATLLLEVDLHSCLAACRVNYKLNAFHAFSSSLRHTALAPDRVLQGSFYCRWSPSGSVRLFIQGCRPESASLHRDARCGRPSGGGSACPGR